MIREDREIRDMQQTIDVLRRCNTLRIAFQGDEYPYVVPVSFGLVQKEGELTVYFHGAKRGFKVDCIGKNPKVSFEGDIFHKVEPTHFGITARYESVIGFGTVEIVQGEEIAEGLKCITEHYGYPDYSIEHCKSLEMTAVFKIKVASLTGKRNVT